MPVTKIDLMSACPTDLAGKSYLESHLTRICCSSAVVGFILGGHFVHISSEYPGVRGFLESGSEVYLVPAFTHDLNVLG